MSWFAYRERMTGKLVLAEGQAEFRHKGTSTELLRIRRVSIGKRGSDITNRWVEVQYGDPTSPTTVYLNDGGWLGWRPLLTSSNRRIAEALQALASDDHA
jgi:hypothetical protein